MTPDRKTLLGCLRGLLRYHRDLGIAAYPRNSGCDTLLRWQAPTVGEALLEKAAGPTSVAGAKAGKLRSAQPVSCIASGSMGCRGEGRKRCGFLWLVIG